MNDGVLNFPHIMKVSFTIPAHMEMNFHWKNIWLKHCPISPAMVNQPQMFAVREWLKIFVGHFVNVRIAAHVKSCYLLYYI